MTSSHGRRIQSRRALAILAWISLVVVAWLLWYGQHKRVIRVQAWEPAALLLSAYAAFLAIFGWLLFSPGRKSAEESPGLFFGGMLTLLPPCFIAYNLMPAGSPLKPWLTIGVFVFGIIAIMSPLPEEVFAVPRDRRTYLRPLTDAYLSELDVDERPPRFDNLAPRTEFRLTQPSLTNPSEPGEARDPWADPFYGTGRQMSRIGVSQSRRAEDSSRTERRRLQDPAATAPAPPVSDHVLRDAQPSFSQLDPRPAIRPTQDIPSSALGPSQAGGAPAPATAVIPVLPGPLQRVTEPTRTVDVRLPEIFGRSTSGDMLTQTPPPVPQSSRRPLTEPSARSTTPVGFQTPPAAKPISSPPPPPTFQPPIIPLTASPEATVAPFLRRPEPSLQELDRQLKELESFADEDDTSATPVRAFPGGETSMPAEISSVTQQTSGDLRLERIRDEHGGEMIEGTIKVFFEVGQKRAHLHVPFSPPLAGLPEVECEPAGDDQIRLKVAVRQPYGVRIEARRAEASEALRTEISFAAVYTPTIRRS